MEIHWLTGIHFFSAQSLPHKYIPSIPVLSPPLSFFFLLPHQKCKEVFSFLRLAPRENSQSIPHTLTWKLISCYQVKCSILHHRLPPISTGFEYSLLLHFLHASVFLYFNFFCMYHRAETGNYLRPESTYFHFYISSIRNSAQHPIVN